MYHKVSWNRYKFERETSQKYPYIYIYIYVFDFGNLCDRATYSNILSKCYWYNRNHTFLLKFFRELLIKSEDLSIFLSLFSIISILFILIYSVFILVNKLWFLVSVGEFCECFTFRSYFNHICIYILGDSCPLFVGARQFPEMFALFLSINKWVTNSLLLFSPRFSKKLY